jgi:hypothetical protein
MIAGTTKVDISSLHLEANHPLPRHMHLSCISAQIEYPDGEAGTALSSPKIFLRKSASRNTADAQALMHGPTSEIKIYSTRRFG